MTLFRDIEYAWRTLVANKGFTAVAVICLALGIGVNTTAFSITDGVLIQPLPYQDAGRLVVLNQSNTRTGVRFGGISYLDLQDWRQQTSAFGAIGAFQGRGFTITDDGEPERLIGGAVGWELFPMLGVQPILGRGFTKEDDRPGAAPVMLLSHAVWQRRYAGDLTIIGRSIHLDGQPYTVIGVMPPRFEFPSVNRVWIPLVPLVHNTPRSSHSAVAFARLKPGVSLERSRDDLTTVSRRLEEQYTENRGWTPLVRPMRDYFIPEDIELVILTMMGAVTLVLLLACANVANLLLARAAARQKEIALRAALGAGRGRIIRQLLTESVILALISTPIGVAIAYYLTGRIFAALPPDNVPSFIGWSVDVRTLVYAIVVALATGIIFGLVPALHAVRTDLQDVLKEGAGGAGGSASRNRIRNALVVIEVALSLVLLVGAMLFVRTFMNLESAGGGFDTRPLMTMRFYLAADTYQSADARMRRVGDILRRVEGLAGVEAAFASNLIPLSGGGDSGPVVIDGRPSTEDERPAIRFVGVTEHLARTLNVPIVEGRPLTESEARTRSGVALISEMMARRFWPDGNRLGQRFRLERKGEAGQWLTVVGVVGDFRHDPLPGDDPLPAAYVPYPYNAPLNTGLTIRVRGEPARVTSAVIHEIRQSDPNVPVGPIRTMEDLRRLGFWPFRIFGWLFAILGGVTLFLAVIGVYGVLSYSIAQRTQEIGLRVALGATRGDVLRLILGQGLRLAGTGIALGLAGAFGATQVVGTVLYRVTPTDPITFGVIVLVLAGVAMAASYLPARQAMAVEPNVALRVD
jgi:predicted permease